MDMATRGNDEIILTDSKRVKCNGGHPSLGHPLTYYDMADEDYVVCRYCDRVFVLKGGKQDPLNRA